MIFISAALTFDNVYPRTLKGTKSSGEEISLDVCAEDNSYVRTEFKLTEVSECSD